MKKILCVLLTVCVVSLSLLPSVWLAQDGTDVWDSTVAEAYESGDGTESSPYEIATAAQFAYFAQQIVAGNDLKSYYVLTSDLDMSNYNWTPITSYSDYAAGNYFKGHFDGQEHTITYSLKPEASSLSGSSCLGLFGIEIGYVDNLNVAGEIIIADNYISGFVGGLVGLTTAPINNCTSSVDITFTETSSVNPIYVGGLVGQSQSGNIQYCKYTGNITVSPVSTNTESYYGGVVGSKTRGTINECINSGTITVNTYSANTYCGGITGGIYTSGRNYKVYVTNCYNTGAIYATLDSTKNCYAGGIAGQVSAILNSSYAGETAIAQINTCFSSGTINAVNTNTIGAVAGRLVAQNNTGDDSSVVRAEVINCYYTGDTPDDNATELDTVEELYEKLTETSDESTWIVDANGDIRLVSEFDVPSTPEAVFTATSDSTGTLTNVSEGMKYSVDGGETYIEITGDSVDIENITAEHGVIIYTPGDNLTTLDSQAQTITVTQSTAPAEITATQCTTSSQNDGTITGVDTTMEYKSVDSDEWIAVTDTSITNLTAGTYEIRVAATGSALASESVTVTVASHTCTAGTQYYYDETNHWNVCECGAIMNSTAHTFVWVVDSQASESQTGSQHEQCSVCGYAKGTVVIPAVTTTTTTTTTTATTTTTSDTTTTESDVEDDTTTTTESDADDDTDTVSTNTSTTSPETGNTATAKALALSGALALLATALYSRKKSKED